MLTIDEHARYGVNATTSTIYGSITPSASLGGSIFIDGRSIWLIPYTLGAGLVPAFNTTISLGGASGKLIGVYSALNVAPTAVAGAMPASGYILVKQWNGTLYGTGLLTGITATAGAGERVGWIEPVGQEGTLCLLSSLDQTYGDGSFSKGDWYEVGTTDGNRATSYQIPTNGVGVYHGGVLVDKAAATNISAMSWSAGVMTVTSNSHGLSTNDRVFIDGVSPRAFRTVDTVVITKINNNSFSYPLASNPGTYTSGGTVAAVEWYPISNTANTKIGTDAIRGKVAWLDQTTGLLRFGNDNTTSTGGYIPVTGLKIRLPNIMTSNATSAAKTVNSLNAAVATRWRWYNGGLGIAKSSHLSGTWSPSVFQTGKQVIMSDSCHHGQLSIASQLGDCTITNVCVGGNGTTTVAYALSLSSLFANTTFTDCVFNGNDIGSTHGALTTSSVYNVTATRCKFLQTGDRSAAVACMNFSIGRNLVFTNCTVGGGVTSSQCSFVTYLNTTIYGASYGQVPVNNPGTQFSLGNLSTNWTIDTITPSAQVASAFQRSNFISVTGSSDNGILRNIGTYASPVDMRRSGYQNFASWSRSGTTVTVTETAHPHAVGDILVVYYTSNSGAITYANKTITAITTNTFDFTGVNTGTTSGTMSYYVSGMVGILSLAGALNTWKVQNVHILGTSGGLLAHGTSDFGLTLQNVTLEPRAYNLTPSWGGNNIIANSIYGPDYPIQSSTSTSGVRGTHFMDWYWREPGTAIPGQTASVVGATWTRSGTTVTVTSTAHGIVGALQRIWIENSSSEAAVANGWGASGITLIVVDANTFTFTGVNAGATSGTLDYRLFGDSIMQFKMSEESPTTTGQSTITVNSGAAGFTGDGRLSLPAVGDQVTYTMPSFVKGFDSFGNVPAMCYGTSLTSLAQTQAFDMDYQLDTGSGFSGTWRNAAYWRTRSSGGTSGTNTMVLTAIGNVQVGDYIMGVGVPSGTKVTGISTNTITLNNNFTANASGIYVFWYMPNESTFPSSGIRLKYRITANATNSSVFYESEMAMLSTTTSRQRLYSQLDSYTLTLSGLQTGSDISIRTAGVVGTALANVDANAGTTYNYTYDYVAGTYIDFDIYKAGYKVAEVKNYLLTAANVTYPISQLADLEYA